MDRRACLRAIGASTAVAVGRVIWAQPVSAQRGPAQRGPAQRGPAQPGPAQAAPAPQDVHFRVLRDGSAIGTHNVVFRQEGGKTIANVDVDLRVRVAFITAFRYRHSSEEVFEGGRLTSVRSTTDDNGHAYGVTGQATSDGFRIEGPGGPFTAPPTLLTSNSAWNASFVRQQALINVQQGGQCGLVASRVGSESIVVRGVPVEAEKYRAMTPQCGGYVWYGPDGRWVRALLEMRGESVEYAFV
jgi:hypothetical protein